MAGRRYSVIHLPFLAFFSKKLYRDIGQNWKGANFAYLFLLLAVCWIPSMLKLREDLAQSFDRNQVHLINQLPDIHIKNGQVDIGQQKPYYIENRKGKVVAIIDTTGSMNYIDDDHVKVLLTESELIIRRGNNQFNTLNLSQVSGFHLNRKIARQWLQTTQDALVPLSYGLFLLLSYIFAVLTMLLTAIVGLVLSNAMHSTLKFAAILRIAVSAATPAIVLITVSSALGQSVPGPAYVAFTILYLLIGIKSCANPAKEQDVPKLKLTELPNEVEKNSDRKIQAA